MILFRKLENSKLYNKLQNDRLNSYLFVVLCKILIK